MPTVSAAWVPPPYESYSCRILAITVTGLVDFVDSADVRVVQRGCGLGLPLKAAEGLRIVREFVGKELQSDVATELEVFRLIHHTHATAADSAENAVMGNRLPHGLGGR